MSKIKLAADLELPIDALTETFAYMKTLLDRTNYSRSSLDSYVQRLAARRLLTCDRGEVTASPNLFDGGRS